MSLPRNYLIVFFACFFPFLAMSQEPNKPTFEKKVFLKDGNTYVQKQLPLYLKFSTDPSGQNYDLTSKLTPEHTNPMYLDTEGPNYIRSKWAVDQKTLKTEVPQFEVMYELYADGLAPITSIGFAGAPKYVGGGVVYYGKGLNVSLSAQDAVSGVEGIHYSSNGAAYSNYASSLQFNTDNANTIHYFSADNVGNAEDTKNRKFTVDVSAPTSNHAISGISYQGNIIAPSTRFRLSASDNLSGVSTTHYSYDSRGKVNYLGSAVGVSYLADGDHVLHYYSIDRVRNEEVHKTFNFYLDKIPPVITVTVEGDQHRKDGRIYVSERTKMNMTATDNKAGVESISYSLDGGGNQNFTSPFNIPNKIGPRGITYYATDNVRNRNNSRSVATTLGVSSIYMDNRAPTTGISYGKPQFFDRDTLFINNKTNITLTARDYESGVLKVDYSVNGASATYNAPFNIAAEGFKTILFQSTDNVNNQEKQKESHTFVDNTPPVIFYNFSIKPIGTKVKDGKTLSIYPNYTRLYLAATDQHCGTQTIKYSMNDEPYFDYSSPYTLDVSEVTRFRKNKYHKVNVKATDKLGNESSQLIEFYVGE